MSRAGFLDPRHELRGRLQRLGAAGEDLQRPHQRLQRRQLGPPLLIGHHQVTEKVQLRFESIYKMTMLNTTGPEINVCKTCKHCPSRSGQTSLATAGGHVFPPTEYLQLGVWTISNRKKRT